MSTAALAPDRLPQDRTEPYEMTGAPGIPLGRLLRVELRKLVDTRSGCWLLVAIALVTLAVIALTLTYADRDSLSFGLFLGATTTPQMLLLPVLGILTVTGEFSQRTGLVTFVQEPRRVRVVLAKLIAASLVGLLAVALAIVLAAVANLIAISVRDAPAVWTWSGGAVGGTALAELLSVWQGVAFGLVLTSPGAAIAAYFIVPVVMTIALSTVRWLATVAPWFDQAAASAPLLKGTMTGTDWSHLAVSHGLWVLLPLLVGTWLLQRREIR
ncbi:ABC transporter permease [Arsenicicoccus dermatophilus]|uniref:ABC transporter permease n=1 Tax=Arsenicicoccus dermatophilus TaxID=1076331 RepID=UPI001F4CFFE0|nr:ABC transporter permease [Arsenicicoccus dermatophilus]MCH8613145.1 ABC transporter permease [Arsenicicoccus dermatophilus]